jgi:hypothetical protein
MNYYYDSLSARIAHNDPTLRTLNLHWNIPVKYARMLAVALAGNTTLQHLDLWGARIGPSGLHALLSALVQNETLLSLDLTDCGIAEDNMGELTTLISKNKSLEFLGLRYIVLSEKGAEKLGAALAVNESLQYLTLWDASISPLGVLRLAGGLAENKFLQTLVMCSCNLGPDEKHVLNDAATRALSTRRRALAELLMRGANDAKNILSELPRDLSITRYIIELAVSPIELI